MPIQDPYFSQVYGCHLKGCLVGSKYRIDFAKRGECVVPNNAKFDVPGEATTMVYIRNDGMAAIYYAINMPNLDTVGTNYLPRGKDREWKFNRVNLKSVNIYVVDPGDDSVSTDIMIETVK